MDDWPDDATVPSFGPRMRCSACGKVGATAVPNWIERCRDFVTLPAAQYQLGFMHREPLTSGRSERNLTHCFCETAGLATTQCFII
jgi:hypothetical protein